MILNWKTEVPIDWKKKENKKLDKMLIPIYLCHYIQSWQINAKLAKFWGPKDNLDYFPEDKLRTFVKNYFKCNLNKEKMRMLEQIHRAKQTFKIVGIKG